MITKNLVLSVCLLVVLVSCNTKRKLPESVGHLSELLVVANDTIWFGPSGDAIRNCAKEEFPNWIHQENKFQIIHIQPALFNENYKRYRNILIVAEQKDSVSITYNNNVWAASQLVIDIKLSNHMDSSLITKAKFQLTESITNNDLALLRRSNKLYGNMTLPKEIHAKYGVNIAVPANYELSCDSANSFIVSNGNNPIKLNLFYARLNDTLLDINAKQGFDIIEALTSKFIKSRDLNFNLKIDKKNFVYDSTQRKCKGLWGFGHELNIGPYICKFKNNYQTMQLEVWFAYVDAKLIPKQGFLLQLESIIPE